MSTSILGTAIDPKFCQDVYYPPFIPHFGKESAFSLITVCLEFLILLFLLSCILRKKWYQCRGLENEARSLLLPFYDRVLYYYCFVTLFRIVFYLAQFMYEIVTPHNTRDVSLAQPFWIVIGDAIGQIGIIGLQVFILFLLMQTSAGTKAYKRAYRGTILVCIIQLSIILMKKLYGAMSSNYILFCIGEIAEESVLFFIFVGVTIYCYFYQMVKHRKRERNKILYVYIALLTAMDLLLMTAYILLIFRIDGYCLDIIEQYLFRLFFPWIAFITIRSDSEFWRMLLLSWQTSSSKAYGENSNDTKDDHLLNKIKAIFGIDSHSKHSFIDPLIDALSLGVKMVDFTELRETSDPFAMGSTATVSTAKLGNEVVAVKVFIFDELSMEVVSEFFRESLLISNLHHDNIVEFKGACLRPPELCLVYEYCCCGDLTHLILTQFFHPQSLRQNNQNNENNAENKGDPKLFKCRIKMLLDVSRGMTRLHDSGIIHRDLKTSNVLVHYQSGKGYIAKVCDFGSARKILTHHQSQNKTNNENTYAPPHNMQYSQSLDDSNHKKKKKKKKEKVVKKTHKIVIENKGKRANTINIAKGAFNRRMFTKKRKKKQKRRMKKESTSVFSTSTQNHDIICDHEEKERQSLANLPENEKTSINYYDIDEEEKYEQPQYRTDDGCRGGESISLEANTELDLEAPITEINYDATQTVNNNRDPTQLAFSVSPILLTTQVGTLAFMAPEILSHVNIGALSGGFQNKEKENNNAAADADPDEKIEEKEEEVSTESEQNLDTAPRPPRTHLATMVVSNEVPPPPAPAPIAMPLERQTTPQTVVIKIDTGAKRENNLSFTSLPASKRSSETKGKRARNEIKSMDIKSASPPTNAQKKFTREYIAKHRELTSRRANADTIAVATPPPAKALPPSPPQVPNKWRNKVVPQPQPQPQARSRNVSIISRIGMFASSYNNDKNWSWQNRDIYAYTKPAAVPPLYNSPSSIKYSIPLNKPHQSSTQIITTNANANPIVTRTTTTNSKTPGSNPHTLIKPKNVQMYAARALPPDPPPQKKKKHKASYFSRGGLGRSRRKLSIGSHLSVMDAGGRGRGRNRSIAESVQSMAHETQRFEIVYEVSDDALYDDSVDVYSFAVIMWEVALCDRIYNEMDMKMIRDMVCQGERMPTPTYKECKRKKKLKKDEKIYGLSNIDETVYNPLIELINECWAQSPVDRPKFFEIQNRLQIIQSLHQMKK